MSVKQQAILDIQEELSKRGKCFIAFVVELDPVMDELVKEQLDAQSSISNSKKS